MKRGGANSAETGKQRRRPWRAAALVIAALAGAGAAEAQEQYSRWEIGGQVSTIRLLNHSGDGGIRPGFGARADFNFTRRLALEGQFDFFPGQAPAFVLEQGGRTWMGVLGIRAKAIQTRRFAAFGLLRPGILHFTGVAAPTAPLSFKPANYLAVNVGGGMEFYPWRRWIARVDVEGDPYRIPNFRVSAPGVTLSWSGKIDDAWRLSVGVSYRVGRLEEISTEAPVEGRWEFGPQVTVMSIQREGALDGVRTEPGIGGFLSYRIWGFLYADAAVAFFPRDTNSSGPHDGGRITQALAGFKSGVRRDHWGLFAKVRPGVNSYSRALKAIVATSPPPAQSFAFQYERANALTLDLGGVMEIYPTKRGTVRFDLGDTHIYFGTRGIMQPDGTVILAKGGAYRHSIQFTVGYGWRF